jgi:hypothetical protein
MMAKFEFDMLELKELLLERVKKLHPEYESVTTEDAYTLIYNINGEDVYESIEGVQIDFEVPDEDS